MGRTEERRVARALPAKRVTRRVARKIGFRFDDSTRRDSLVAIAYDYATQQGARQCARFDRQPLRPEPDERHAATFSATSARALCVRSSVGAARTLNFIKELSVQRRRTYGITNLSPIPLPLAISSTKSASASTNRTSRKPRLHKTRVDRGQRRIPDGSLRKRSGCTDPKTDAQEAPRSPEASGARRLCRSRGRRPRSRRSHRLQDRGFASFASRGPLAQL